MSLARPTQTTPVTKVLLAWLNDRLACHGQCQLFVGFSGGLDSSVLLSALQHLRLTYCYEHKVTLTAVYVNHMTAYADQCQAHCQAFCDSIEVPLICETLGTLPISQNKEAEWRKARYELFASKLNQASDCLLTAHHLDDQVETFLLQALRGAGPKGLSAMPEMKPLSKGLHYRPLLRLPQSALKEYAIDNALNWLDDPSNQDTQFERNWIRHKIMPTLHEGFGNKVANLAVSAEQCANQEKALSQLVSNWMVRHYCHQRQAIPLPALVTENIEVQQAIVRHWIDQLNWSMPPRARLMTFLSQLVGMKSDRHPELRWSGEGIKVAKGYLFPLHCQIESTNTLNWQAWFNALPQNKQSKAKKDYAKSPWPHFYKSAIPVHVVCTSLHSEV